MTFRKIVIKTRGQQAKTPLARLQVFFEDRPKALVGSLLGLGCLLGMGMSLAVGAGSDALLRTKVAQQQQELAKVRADAQTQVNALAARLGELQAQATRLNALGERLTRMGKLEDGEFYFN